MSPQITCHEVLRAPEWSGAIDGEITLDYEARMVRRKRLKTDAGEGFHIDIAQTISLAPGDILRLSDGRHIAVCAAKEALLCVRGNLLELAWHIGNRHTPCQMGADHLLLREDPVLARMLAQLGAEVTQICAEFHPLGGAYGHGRTMGHDHGHSHEHSKDHGHSHD
ncbi:MAG: urease accessory protein [Halocynthiibacter sp.]|jgi:urease accessory protein